MKKLLTIFMFCGVCCGYAQNTPPYAASTKTWVIKADSITQIWSDVIQIPACNKANFKVSNVVPQCRSYKVNMNTYYYYNWAYVNANASKLCPSPWRVPIGRDNGALLGKYAPADWSNDTYAGYQIETNEEMHHVTWGSDYSDGQMGAVLYIDSPSRRLAVGLATLAIGMPVRCVR
jgi:hypothetical protein